ncbi:hypothetical protein ACFQY4_39925 [Catellatospora bangladeshensis]|uniref:Uncharacterized protein n=1 Tax=Catellatospora bangladeshensis TaxID=310355 RepID=A0A8J3JND7_9ACTN|nr:hypothetical protein Cba03nite_52150 [Catellatospora bangladeshensis]
MAEQFAPGRGGAANMTIEKDRPGGVRAHSPVSGKSQPAGRFVMTAELDGSITWHVTKPKISSGSDGARDADIAELYALNPPPTSKRDVQKRLGWGSDRAVSALAQWRALEEAKHD